MLDEEAFQRSFICWIEQVFTMTERQVIAIDDNPACRSYIIRAQASENGLTPGQPKVCGTYNNLSYGLCGLACGEYG